MTAVEWFAMITGAWKYASKAQLEQAKEMEKEQMINFALFRDDYLEKANTLEDFTISNEKLIRLFKHTTFKSE